MKQRFRGSEVQRFVLLVCFALTACGTVAQAAEAPQIVVEPTAEHRVPVITDVMRSAMDASAQPEEHECRANPLAILWHPSAKQYAILCKISGTTDQYGIVYFNEDGSLRNTSIVQSYGYNEFVGGLMWMGFEP